jgi:hypothetical protein
MNLNPPPTPKELQDLRVAIRDNITWVEFINNEVWFNTWGSYLIGLRRGYQKRFLSEAYNEHSASS